MVYSSFIRIVLKISKHPVFSCRQAWGCFYKNSDTVRGVITYLQYRCFPVDSIYNNRSHNYHSLCETKQNIFLYTTMLYRVFDLLRFSGVDESRTRVQRQIRVYFYYHSYSRIFTIYRKATNIYRVSSLIRLTARMHHRYRFLQVL